jgi:thiamine biosynthesis lipoprotein
MLQSAHSIHTSSRLRTGMGTLIAVEVQAGTAHAAQLGIESAFAAVAQVETLMHPTRTGSDLAAIRGGAIGGRVTVHAWTWEVLALSQRLNRLSQGAFDPCVPESAGRISDLEFAAPLSVIAHRPLRIDLGGIAKGFAVDRALAALRDAGCHGGLVNAGGDLAVFGVRSHTVVVRGEDGRGSVVELKDAALASSAAGVGAQAAADPARPAEHRGYYHGRDLGPIAPGRVSVSAPAAAVADALTKCLLADRDRGAALLDLFDARLAIDAGPHEWRLT